MSNDFKVVPIAGPSVSSGVVGSLATRVVSAGDGPGIIQNLDVANTIYIGEDTATTPGDINHSSPLLPGTPMGFDGTQDIYAGALPGQTANLAIYPSATSTIVPGFIADQIQISGVPPIDDPVPLYVVFNQTIAAGASFTSPEISVSRYQSWVSTMFATATSSGTGTNPFTQYTMKWSLAVDNFDPLITHDWTIPNTPFNFVYNYRNDGDGPVFGDSLSMTWTNFDSQPVNVTIGIFGSYRTRIRPKQVGRYHYVVATGNPDPTRGFGSDGIVEIYNPAPMPLAPGATANPDLMNLLDGPTVVNASAIFNAAGNNGFGLIIQPQPTVLVSMSILLQVFGTTIAPVAGSPSLIIPPTQIMLPRRACTIELINYSNSADPINSAQATVIAMHQPE